MPHLICESCNSHVGPILPRVMGDGSTMYLCPQCRATWAKPIEGEELAYWQGYWDALNRSGQPTQVNVQLDVKTLAKAVMAELPSVIRNASGKRNY